MIRQKTLKNSMRASGIGLHSGRKVNLTLRPAPVNTGVVFRRVDLPGAPLIPARADHVVDTMLCTVLGNEHGRVGTVEHLMSALAGLQIDNVFIDIDGDEVPIMDGSSAPFVFLIQCAGIEEQKAPRLFIKIKKPFQVEAEGKVASFLPGEGFSIRFAIDFNHPMLRNQTAQVRLNETSFIREVSRARTFGFLKEVETLQSMGLAQGGSLDNAIVIDDYRIVNEGGLRYPDEFVRHKILDSVGDLYLLGHPVIGVFEAERSGHALNNRLLRGLLADESAYDLVQVPKEVGTSTPAKTETALHPQTI
ncbi:MAG: UDP-3-O-[3-hydroxymyristoyl] N-acetylglucosamine deacetylase [Alphaproteobacteria bacterium CG_4_10_14_0_2_um_filter_63_37]|nr:MAG: UDP-3-O-[3-hydroxymyristoyl] N-acetylglucosamine deacetylase [Proteobacteria bacterium CG1_02_64_396]PJA24037.1 MAG: UDP-3-O-[3-hydroxymyristoyl] N-acetylglucosamine deacetylase [Alphaproteobacteria bacterium CG_4_10_14_0_2_um_filter_63_37]